MKRHEDPAPTKADAILAKIDALLATLVVRERPR